MTKQDRDAIVAEAREILKTQRSMLNELRKRRDKLTLLIRDMDHSLNRLERQIKVTGRVDDEYSLEALQVLKMLIMPAVEPLKVLVQDEAKPSEKEEEILIAVPGPTMILMGNVLSTLAQETPPLTLEAAAAQGLKEDWAEKAYSMKDGGKTVRFAVAEFNADAQPVICPKFREHLSQIFRRLRRIHFDDLPDGAKPSKTLANINDQIAQRWEFIERIVVDHWLPEELADLRTS